MGLVVVSPGPSVTEKCQLCSSVQSQGTYLLLVPRLFWSHFGKWGFLKVPQSSTTTLASESCYPLGDRSPLESPSQEGQWNGQITEGL